MMTELMKQLQQWADEGRYDWEKGAFNWLGIIERDLPRPLRRNHKSNWVDFVNLVLDGTIQVRRPVKHYPLPISKKYHAEYIEGFDSRDEDILVFVADPQGDYRTVTTLFYRIDSFTFNLTNEIDATFPFKGKWIDRITHWQPLPPL